LAAFKPKYPRKRKQRSGWIWRLPENLASWIRRPGRVRRHRPQVAVGRQRHSLGWINSKSMLVAVCVCVAFAVSVFSGYRFLDQSDIFRLSSVKVSGLRMVRRNEILDSGGIEIGMGLFSFDVAAAARKISAHPWIAKVSLVRSWPSTLEIHVQEYRPLAMINVENGSENALFYVDPQGKVFARVTGNDDLDFPVITGLETENEVLGTIIGAQGIAAKALLFLRLAARGNPILPLQSVSEVHVSPARGLIVYLVDRPFPIYMGDRAVKQRHNLLVKLLERLYRKKKFKELKEIRMDYGKEQILVAKVES